MNGWICDFCLRKTRSGSDDRKVAKCYRSSQVTVYSVCHQLRIRLFAMDLLARVRRGEKIR